MRSGGRTMVTTPQQKEKILFLICPHGHCTPISRYIQKVDDRRGKSKKKAVSFLDNQIKVNRESPKDLSTETRNKSKTANVSVENKICQLQHNQAKSNWIQIGGKCLMKNKDTNDETNKENRAPTAVCKGIEISGYYTKNDRAISGSPQLQMVWKRNESRHESNKRKCDTKTCMRSKRHTNKSTNKIKMKHEELIQHSQRREPDAINTCHAHRSHKARQEKQVVACVKDETSKRNHRERENNSKKQPRVHSHSKCRRHRKLTKN